MGLPLCSKKCGKGGRIAYCVGFAAVFIFLSAMRFQVGYDYNSYGGMYFNMKYMGLEEVTVMRAEKGFLMPLYVLNLAVEDYRTVFIYTSLIIYSAVFYLIYKESSNPWISVVAYLCFGLFFNSLCFLRQVMAALLCGYAVRYVDERRPFRFAVLVIAAASFHWSALIMLALYFFLRIKPSYIYLGAVALCTAVFCVFSKSLLSWAVDTFYMYSNYNPETSVEVVTGLTPLYTIMFGVLFAVAFAFRKRLAEKNSKNDVYLNCLMFTTVFEAMGIKHAILSRFALIVYIPPILFMLPDLIQVIREYMAEKITAVKRRQAMNICTAVAGSVFAVGCYALLMADNYNGVMPYVSQMNRSTDIFVEEVLDDADDYEWSDEEWEEWEEESDGEEWDNENLDNGTVEDSIIDTLDEPTASEPVADEPVSEEAPVDVPEPEDTISDDSEDDFTDEEWEAILNDDDWEDDSFDQQQFDEDILSQLG